jgi:hypothetical protein
MKLNRVAILAAVVQMAPAVAFAPLHLSTSFARPSLSQLNAVEDLEAKLLGAPVKKEAPKRQASAPASKPAVSAAPAKSESLSLLNELPKYESTTSVSTTPTPKVDKPKPAPKPVPVKAEKPKPVPKPAPVKVEKPKPVPKPAPVAKPAPPKPVKKVEPSKPVKPVVVKKAIPPPPRKPAAASGDFDTVATGGTLDFFCRLYSLSDIQNRKLSVVSLVRSLIVLL